MKRFGLMLSALLFIAGCCYTCKFLREPDLDQRQFIRDSYGRICIYHGVSVSNFSKNSGALDSVTNRKRADTCWQQLSDFQRMPGWGFNLVRQLWHWEAIEPVRDQFDKGYVSRQLMRIAWARSCSTDVIVDPHQDLFAQRFCGDGFPDWAIMKNAGKFGGCRTPWNLGYLDTVVIKNYNNFWNNDDLQNKYVNMIDSIFSWVDTIPNVIGVEIMNEPFPDLSAKFERVKLTRLYDQVQTMVKAKGYKKLIIYEPWMSTSTGIPTCLKFAGGEGTVYSWHYYDPAVDAGKPYGPINYGVMQEALTIKVREAQEFHSPGICTEFAATPEYVPYLTDLLNLFDKYGLSWSYYSYDLPQYCGYAFIDQNKNPLPTLSALVRIYPQKIAGNNPKYEIVDKTFTLNYEKIDTDQPTVIFVPEGLNIKVETEGQHQRVNQHVLYTNTRSNKQSIKIVWN